MDGDEPNITSSIDAPVYGNASTKKRYLQSLENAVLEKVLEKYGNG